jgi:hypothetical protein
MYQLVTLTLLDAGKYCNTVGSTRLPRIQGRPTWHVQLALCCDDVHTFVKRYSLALCLWWANVRHIIIHSYVRLLCGAHSLGIPGLSAARGRLAGQALRLCCRNINKFLTHILLPDYYYKISKRLVQQQVCTFVFRSYWVRNSAGFPSMIIENVNSFPSYSQSNSRMYIL